MNGQLGISSKVFDWPAGLVESAASNVALYKEIRNTIAHADVYHLTGQPAHNNPKGWMAIQYVTRDAGKSVVTVYRLEESLAAQTFKLRGLSPSAKYQMMSDGKDLGTMTGKALMNEGLSVTLEGTWRASVIELKGDAH
jgi:alpha-galactosidase